MIQPRPIPLLLICLVLLTMVSSALASDFFDDEEEWSHDGDDTAELSDSARIALQQLGAPYRYGGNTPAGFDCSGLVHYSYSRAGYQVPRSSSAQYQHSQHLPAVEMRPGDLVFFRISPNKISHVGIYLGDDRFIHAPSSGKRVRISSLNNHYWKQRLVSARRLVD